jgi:OOP family OmpA-OmpF porin
VEKDFDMRFLTILMFAVAFLVSPAQAGIFGGYFDTDSADDLSVPDYATPFQKTLFSEYLALSDDRTGDFDFIDGEHFNHKARSAARRHAIHTDRVMDRRLDNQEYRTLTNALLRLEAVYYGGGRELAPTPTAIAQVAFDCWIEAAESNRSEDVQRCKARFMEAIEEAEKLATYDLVVLRFEPVEVPEIETAQPVSAPQPPSVPPQEYYLVYFKFDSTDFTNTGQRNLRKAIRDLQDIPQLKIDLVAHADRSGPSEYNMKLSQRRAERVLNELTDAGVDTSRLKIVEAVGETRPLIPTGDGIKNQQNRVVEIDLSAN